MRRRRGENGYLLVDMVMALALFGFVLLSIYHLYGPTFALSRDINGRLAAQQDVRLALDRVARALHETTTATWRFRIYPAEAGCAGAYQACLGFVTARDGNCAGAFQLVDGAPNWQATLYLWRDTASNELRLRCDPSATFPTVTWPPRELTPYSVVGTQIVAASISPQPAGIPRPTAIAILLEEEARTSVRRSPTTTVNETIFLPQNR